MWAGQGAVLAATVCSNAHYSSVDCVRVVRAGAEQVVVSGSRDRGINLWSVAEVRDKGAVRPTLKVPDAHKGESSIINAELQFPYRFFILSLFALAENISTRPSHANHV